MLSAIEAKAHGLWLSGKLIWVSLKGEPWLLVEGEGNAVSLLAPDAAPGCCWLEPFVVGRNRQHPALHGIRPQSLTSGAFKKKKKKKSCLTLMILFFRGSWKKRKQKAPTPKIPRGRRDGGNGKTGGCTQLALAALVQRGACRSWALRMMQGAYLKCK